MYSECNLQGAAKQIFYLNISLLDVCQPKTTVVSSSDDYSVARSAEKMLFYVKCEVNGDETFFLGKNGATNVKVVLDFGCQVRIAISGLLF